MAWPEVGCHNYAVILCKVSLPQIKFCARNWLAWVLNQNGGLDSRSYLLQGAWANSEAVSKYDLSLPQSNMINKLNCVHGVSCCIGKVH